LLLAGKSKAMTVKVISDPLRKILENTAHLGGRTLVLPVISAYSAYVWLCALLL